MGDRRKPKSDSVLKNLPHERQEQIAEWCAKPNDLDANGDPIPRTGGLAFARAQLAADGFAVSLDTLSRFSRWWDLEQDMDAADAVRDQVLERTGDIRKAREAGENMLMRLGLAKQDTKLLVASAQIIDSRRQTELRERELEAKVSGFRARYEQKERELKLAQEKHLAAIRTKIEQGLAALREAIAGNAAAEAAAAQLELALEAQ